MSLRDQFVTVPSEQQVMIFHFGKEVIKSDPS